MRVKVVINPGAGQPEPVLSILNDTLGAAGIEWDVAVTHLQGDGFAAARVAVDEGWDLIGAYGGDGTLAEVASALAQGGPPMAVLPGGTGNALAEDLGIPRTLEEATALVASGDYDLRRIDMGLAGDTSFILRLTMGFEASLVEAATREMKDRYGWLAYAFAGLRQLSSPPTAHYHIDVDGEVVEVDGLACIVANSASTGILGVRIADDVSLSDGLLDVVVIGLPDLASYLGSAADAATGQPPRAVSRWKGKRIRVESSPPQSVLADGEPIGMTPVEASATPGAITVVVPKAGSDVGAR